ncbi:MAG: Gfo/Idh/MocA family oxidoreductase [Planctomycetaceae bacterium]
MHADRRTFLLASSSAVTAAFASSSLFGGPNDQVNVGLIGCGGRGPNDADKARDNVHVALTHVCDPDDGRRALVAKRYDVSESRSVRDMRVLLDDKSLDAVIIATPDHWHSPAAILACEAGKHVYVEKPISHNIREGRLLIDAAARNKVQVQHGTQSRSTPMMIEAVKALRDGIIGDVLVAKCWNIQRRGPLDPGRDTDPPEGFDYDTWVGPATMIPYRTNRVHTRWTWWYHFGTGDMGNDGVHDIDYCRWGLGVDTHPNEVHAPGGKFDVDDEKEFPDTQQVTFKYNGDGKVGSQRIFIFEMRLWSHNYPFNVDSGAEFYGKSGQMFLSRRGKIQVIGDDNKPVKLDIKPGPQDDVAHIRNWLGAIREGGTLTAPPHEGHLSASLCHLGNISTRLGRALRFDPAAEKFIGDDEANTLVGREYRDHWGRPKGA